MDLDLLSFDQDTPSYNEFGSYLCREVFTDMSVLPLVFPSNISCFSQGSYKEELARKRELPVPPQPRRSGGVLARSDDNLAGAHSDLLSSLSVSAADSGSVTPLTRHSSLTWLTRGHDMEMEDTCMLATQLRRRYEEVRSRAVAETLHTDLDQDTEEEPELAAAAPPPPPSPPPPRPETEAGADSSGELAAAGETAAEDAVTAVSEAVICQDVGNMDEKEASVDKMSVFKKKEKTSLFQRTIDRISFKSRRKKDKDKTSAADVNKSSETSEPRSFVTSSSSQLEEELQHEIQTLEESPKLSARHLASLTSTPARSPPSSLVLGAPRPPATPTSARYTQSRPIKQLDQALRSFTRDTAASRENLSQSRPDLAAAISVFTASASKPSTPLQPRVELRRLRPPSSAPPPATSSRWRQVAPARSSALDSEWARLSASMANLSTAGAGGSLQQETSLASRPPHLASSNMSLDLRTSEQPEAASRPLDRAMSVNVLTSVEASSSSRDSEAAGVARVPDNSLRGLNPYQRRIQASMEKLNVPAWYKSPAPATPSPAPARSATLPSGALGSSWRTASLSTSGWRRHNPGPGSAASTLERQSCLVTSQRFRGRGSTLPPAASSTTNLASATPSSGRMYLGWRSQERLDIGPAYLTSPAQRLATSAVVVRGSPAKVEARVQEDIKEVAEAIMDYCSPASKPAQVKQAWLGRDEDSENSDNPDDDSGIDRSDDFTQEILNEA